MVVVQFIFPPAVFQHSNCSRSLTSHDVFKHFNLWHSTKHVMVTHLGFNLHFCNGWWCWESSCMLIYHLHTLSGDVSLLIFCHIFIRQFVLLLYILFFCYMLYVLEFFIYSAYESFIRYMLCKYVLPICDLSFYYFNAFLEEKFLNLMKSSLSCVYFMDHTFGVIYKKSLPNLWSQRVSPMFSARSFYSFRFKM